MMMIMMIETNIVELKLFGNGITRENVRITRIDWQLFG